MDIVKELLGWLLVIITAGVGGRPDVGIVTPTGVVVNISQSPGDSLAPDMAQHPTLGWQVVWEEYAREPVPYGTNNYIYIGMPGLAAWHTYPVPHTENCKRPSVTVATSGDTTVCYDFTSSSPCTRLCRARYCQTRTAAGWQPERLLYFYRQIALPTLWR